MPTILGIDLGTQSLKTLFYDAESKKVIASASALIKIDMDSTGKAEQSASWWLTALEQALAEISPAIKNQTCAIGVSGQQHGFVPLDCNGEVLAPVKLWCDTSTQQECNTLIDAYGGNERCIENIGNVIASGFTASKILWLKNHKPDTYKKLHTILLPHDYLNFHLSGQLSMEYGDASGTALLNIKTREWDHELLQIIDSERDLLACLPTLHHLNQAAGTLTEMAANRYGLPAGIPISTGGGDNMMGAIGTGNISDGVVTMSLGSSGTVFAHSSKPVVDKQGRLAAFCPSTEGWLPLLCSMNCTLSTELMRKLLNQDLVAFEKLIASVAPGAGGIQVLPFFNGERTPNLPNAKGTILGLDSTNFTDANLLRATVEGICFGLRLGIDALQENGVSVNEIRLTGGGSKSEAWRQMIADICQTSVVLTTPDEGAAFGAALQALYIYELNRNGKANIEEIAKSHVQINNTASCKPNTHAVQTYEQLFKQYQRAIEFVGSYYQTTKI